MKVVRDILIIIVVLAAINSYSQPHPGYNGDGSGSGGGPVGGAPIGGGLLIVLSLGAGYGLLKLYNANKRKLDE